MGIPSDMSSLFSRAPSGPSQDVRYRQGVIVTFDANTLENTVLVDEGLLTNLPLLGVGEATLLAPGAIVGIVVIGDNNRGKTMAILGRFVTPNTADAFDAISLLSSRTFIDYVEAIEATTSMTYGDLTTPGPELTIDVPMSGRILLTFGAFMDSGVAAGGNTNVAAMALEFSGNNVIAAAPPYTATAGFVNANIQGIGTYDKKVYSVVAEGLTPGETTITAKYRNAASTLQVQFGNRILIAQLL